MRVLHAIILSLGLASGAGDAGAGEPPEATKYFSQEQIERGRSRSRHSLTLWIVSVVWTVLLLAALLHPTVGAVFVKAGGRIAGVTEGCGNWRRIAGTAATIALMVAALAILRMPFSWARGYFLEHAWGLSNQSASSFFLDWVKSFIITMVLYTVGFGAVAVMRSLLPAWWPVVSWAIVSTLIVVMVFIWPILMDPLFNNFTRVGEKNVLERVEAITGKAGLEVGEILWIEASAKTKRTNAYFTGLGATKRIVLYDTLKREDGTIDGDRLDEVETILAHEAGHWQHGHMLKGTLLSLLGVAGFFLAVWLALRFGPEWLPARELPAGARVVPLMMLMALGGQILFMPVANGISRSWERDCDRASLELSGKPEAFIRAEVELARTNISNITPGAFTVLWLYTHPPVLERIQMGEEYLSSSQKE